MNGTALTIGEAAKACGLSSKNIRYYEQIGLIPKAARHNDSARTGGNRFYRDADLRRLRLIRSSRLLGLGLKDIAQLLDLLERGNCPGAQPKYREKLRHQLASVSERIERLIALQADLEEMIARSERGELNGRCGCSQNSGVLTAVLDQSVVTFSRRAPRGKRNREFR